LRIAPVAFPAGPATLVVIPIPVPVPALAPALAPLLPAPFHLLLALGLALQLGGHPGVDRHRDVSDDVIVNPEPSLQLALDGAVPFVLVEDVVSLPVLPDSAGQLALAPLVGLDQLAFVFGDDGLEGPDDLVDLILGEIGLNDVERFVLLHLVSSRSMA